MSWDLFLLLPDGIEYVITITALSSVRIGLEVGHESTLCRVTRVGCTRRSVRVRRERCRRTSSPCVLSEAQQPECPQLGASSHSQERQEDAERYTQWIAPRALRPASAAPLVESKAPSHTCALCARDSRPCTPTPVRGIQRAAMDSDDEEWSLCSFGVRSLGSRPGSPVSSAGESSWTIVRYEEDFEDDGSSVASTSTTCTATGWPRVDRQRPASKQPVTVLPRGSYKSVLLRERCPTSSPQREPAAATEPPLPPLLTRLHPSRRPKRHRGRSREWGLTRRGGRLLFRRTSKLASVPEERW